MLTENNCWKRSEKMRHWKRNAFKLPATRIFLKQCLFVVYLVAMSVSGELANWFVFFPPRLGLFSFDFFLVTTVQSVKLYFLLRKNLSVIYEACGSYISAYPNDENFPYKKLKTARGNSN